MHRTVLAIALAASIPAAFAGSDPLHVNTKKLADGTFELTVTVPDITDPAVAQKMLMPVAAGLCGRQSPLFGKYSFKSDTPLATAGTTTPTSLVLVQQIHCDDGAGASEPAGAEVNPPDEPPSQADEAAINARTLEYLSAKDRGDFGIAYAMLADTTKSMMTNASWRKPRMAFNAIAGAPLQRQVLRVTWYDNPPGAPRLGRYAAADYSASYADASFYCGYVVWLRQSDGSYRIVREEEGQIDAAVARKVPPGDMATVRAQMGCRD